MPPLSINPDCWRTTPITLPFNPLTGYNLGEDGDHSDPKYNNPGFRGMKTLAENDEPLVVPALENRCPFDGRDEYGNPFNPEIVLPGELEGRVLAVRESVALFLDFAQQILTEVSPGMQLVGLDGFESWKRQSSGFSRVLRGLLSEANIKEPTATELHTLGKKANGTYCFVKADDQSEQYKALEKELRSDAQLMQELSTLARSQGEDNLADRVSRILNEVITISSNGQIGVAKDRNVPLNFESNAHAGGAAVDLMIADEHGKLLSLTPYCHIGEEAGMAYMEDEGAYEKFKARTSEDKKLQTHLAKIGFPTVDAFTPAAWEQLKEVRRIRFHLIKALGATFYSAHDPKEGGEDWHIEPGNILYTLDGGIWHSAPTAKTYPDSGNPGHTLQKLGGSATAVYGGGSAHKLAREKFKLAA